MSSNVLGKDCMVRRNLVPTRPPTHPGAILREDVLPALGMSVSDVAKAPGVSRQKLHRILAETASGKIGKTESDGKAA